MLGAKLTERTLVLMFGIVPVCELGIAAVLFHVGVDRLLGFLVRQLQYFERLVWMALLGMALKNERWLR